MKLLDHFERMQKHVGYLLEGKSSEKHFVNSMIYLLDGPEQREAQAEAKEIAKEREAKDNELTITITGPVASGKTLWANAILDAYCNACGALPKPKVYDGSTEMTENEFYSGVMNDGTKLMQPPFDYVDEALRIESNVRPLNVMQYGSNSNRLLHAAMGMVTEAGEFMDALKKRLFYGKPLDTTNLKEEIGDLLWYIAIAVDALGTSIDAEMQHNIAKLRARYPAKFDATQAVTRDLAAEREVLESDCTPANILYESTAARYPETIAKLAEAERQHAKPECFPVMSEPLKRRSGQPSIRSVADSDGDDGH